MEPPVASTNTVREVNENTMAKEEVKEVKKDPRQARWEEFLKRYAVSNPVKYARKKENGEFDKIPDSFK
jgi:hypothetical protein